MLAKRTFLVTGADGFIGKNLIVHLSQLSHTASLKFVRTDDISDLPDLVSRSDAVVHLAGENRPLNPLDFEKTNVRLTSVLCEAIEREIRATNRRVPLVFASSTQAECNNPYGRSKYAAEQTIRRFAEKTGNPCIVFRLPGVFGKWCKPNYNSVVATFCHNVARDLSIQLSDPLTSLRLVYIDDVITAIFKALELASPGFSQATVEPEYEITLGDLAAQIRVFSETRATHTIERVGTGFVRALYSTYVSYLPKEKFFYDVPLHGDSRGVFVEMLKTSDSGQFSYFTAHPGVTRGGHYHHTKTEKFLVVKGEALFRFRHILTNQLVEFRTGGKRPQIVETIPGWAHDITNIGNDEMVVMLWANENFDRERPDTVVSVV